MKIAISATGKNIDNLLDMSFGGCEYFQIHDMETGKFVVIENKGLACNADASIIASQQLVDENVNVIVTANIESNALEIIQKSKIKPYKCGNIAIQSVLEKFKNNELEEIKIA